MPQILLHWWSSNSQRGALQRARSQRFNIPPTIKMQPFCRWGTRRGTGPTGCAPLALCLIKRGERRPDQSSKSGWPRQLQSELAVGKCDSLHSNGHQKPSNHCASSSHLYKVQKKKEPPSLCRARGNFFIVLDFNIMQPWPLSYDSDFGFNHSWVLLFSSCFIETLLNQL